MRLKMTFRLKKPELDIEYRRMFLSLLKNAFQQASQEVFDRLYGNGTPMKPFTFGVFLTKPQFRDNSILLDSPDITLNFSTPLTELGIYFYNSMIRRARRFEAYPLSNGNDMILIRVSLTEEKQVTGNEAVFRTISPFLIRLHNKESNEDRYLAKHDESFGTEIENNCRIMLKELTGNEETVLFTPVTIGNPIPIRHFGILVEGNTGIFKLIGNPQVLEFIYKTGIGSRRSEGFGLLELIG